VSNANTIKRQVGGSTVGTLAPLLGSFITTTESLFIFNWGPQGNPFTFSVVPVGFSLNPSYLAGGCVPLSAGVLSASSLYQQSPNETGFAGQGAQTTPFYSGTGQVIHIAATGTLAGLTANSTTLALSLYEVPADALLSTLTTTASLLFTAGGQEVAATSAEEFTTTTSTFSFDVYLQLDAQGNLMGTYQAVIGGNVISETATTLVAGLIGDADLNFALVATLGGTYAGVVVTVDEFRIDLE